MQQPNNMPILYAQICPEQPRIPNRNRTYNNSPQPYENQIQDQLSQATRVFATKHYAKPLKYNQFQPKIIRGRRIPYHQSFQAIQRSRQIKSMANRIENVKSMQQRKKDKHDAIVYPPYFVRNGGLSSDVRIDGYTKKVLNNTSWKQRQKQINKIYELQKNEVNPQQRQKKQVKKYQYQQSPKLSLPELVQPQNPDLQNQLPTPIFYKKQPAILKPISSTPIYTNITKRVVNELPQNDIRSILDYVYNHLLYKDQDLQALKSRMIHAYGKQKIINTWRLAMKLLKRDI